MTRYRQEHKRSWRTVTSALMFALAFFYLGFHALNGERGFYALLKEERKRDALREELAQVRAERESLEKQLSGLSAESLDLDLLDERSRVVLGYTAKDEVVVPLPQEEVAPR